MYWGYSGIVEKKMEATIIVIAIVAMIILIAMTARLNKN